MAKKIFDQVGYVNLVLNKYNYFKTFVEITDALHRAQLERFEMECGSIAGYQPGRPVPRVAYQLTKTVSEHLQPFLKTQVYTRIANPPELPISSGGAINVPPDFVHATSLRTDGGLDDVDVVEDNKVNYRLHSKVIVRSAARPMAEATATGYQLYTAATTGVSAADVDRVTLKYLSFPIKPAYATTVVEDDLVYDDATSVDMLWNEVCVNWIIFRALGDLGINVKDNTIIPYSEAQKQKQG